MANDTTVDQQQLQTTIDELYRKLTELFPAQRDALRNALNTIQVGENQALGMLAAADDLSTAPVGDQAALLNAIGLGVLSGALNAADLAAFRAAIDLGSAATQPDSRYAKLSGTNNFDTMPSINGNLITEIGSNSNGTYIRFSNRLQICLAQKVFPGLSTATASGSIFVSNPLGGFSFPASFSSVIGTSIETFNAADNVKWVVSDITDFTKESQWGSIRIADSNSEQTPGNVVVSYMAIGVI